MVRTYICGFFIIYPIPIITYLECFFIIIKIIKNESL